MPDQQIIRPTSTHRIARRTLLTTAATGAAVAAVTPSALAAPASGGTGVTAILDRRRAQLVGDDRAASATFDAKRATLDAEAGDLLATLDRSTGRAGIWPDLPLTGIGSDPDATGNLGVTFERLLALASVYAMAGSRYAGDDQLATDLVDALDHVLEVAYRPTITPAGNWWFWEIGVPRKGADTAILLGSALPTTTRDTLLTAIRTFAPDPNYRGRTTALAETGANRVDKALSCILRGALDGSSADLAAGRDALSDVAGGGKASVFATVTSGDGFYADGSFVQHSFLPYAGTYGSVALIGIARTLALLAGTEAAITDPAVDLIFDSVEKTFAPFMWDLHVMDTVRGRAVSRQDEPDFLDGFTITEATVTLAASAPAARAARLESVAKGWLTRSTDRSMITDEASTLPQALAASALLDDTSVRVAGPPRLTKFFAGQERLVHHTRDWAFTVSTSSARIGRYEWGNAENKHGWYQGDGASYLYHRRDPGQFCDDYWPTVDALALPGITADTLPRPDGPDAGTGVPRAANAYHGGVTLNSSIGTVATDFTNQSATVSALTSWFTLPDGIVCVGSEVINGSGAETVTIMEGRLFDVGRVPALTVDNHRTGSAVSDRARPFRHWAHIEDHAGYLLLPSARDAVSSGRLQVRRLTGSWRDINSGADTGGDTEIRSKDAVRLDLSHGRRPRSGYAYLILPLASLGQTRRRAADPGVRIRVADEVAHVIEAHTHQAVLAHFFAAGRRGGIEVDGPCALGWQRRGRRTEISVSDPTHTLDQLTVQLPLAPSRHVIADDAAVRLTGAGRHRRLTLQLDLSGSRGAQRTVVISD